MKPNSNDWTSDNEEASNEVAARASAAGRRLLLGLLGRWYWVVLGAVLGGAVSFHYLSKAPKIYSSTATLLVKDQAATVLSKDQPEEIDMRSAEALNTVAERLKRRVLLENVVSREEIRSLPGLIPEKVQWLPEWLAHRFVGVSAVSEAPKAEVMKPAELARKLSGMMTITVRRNTRLVDITFSHPMPEVARHIADGVALEYIAEVSDDRSSGRTNTIELLSKKADEARVSLQAAQKAFAAYQRALASHEELEIKEKEVIELSRRLLGKHPEMINAKAQVVGLQERFLDDFDASVKSGADEAYWKLSKAEWKPGSKPLNEQLEVARRMVLSRTAVLKSEIQSQESVFDAILTKLQQSDVNQSAKESEIEISSLALLPDTPVSPVKALILMVGVVGGSGIGLGIAFIGVVLNNKFHSVAEVEELTGMPVLAAVSRISRGALNDLAKLPEAEAGKFEHEKDWDPKIVFRRGLSSTSFAEMFRVLRASITLLGFEEERKITLFTSAIPGEGKTTCSANFALAAAGQGKRVLLVDMDLRKPAQHKIFGLALDVNQAGVSGCLTGKATLDEAVFQVPGVPNLDLLLSGARAPNPGELLNGGRIAGLLAEIRGKYDVIVLDTAPLLAVPDARILAAYADNICLVVRADYVPKGAAHRAISLLESGKTAISGIVLNGFKERRRLIGGSYSYGYYKYGSNGKSSSYGYGSYGTYGTD
ncbi:MAG: polysaccharide biosynthesis tyrosine autokinase [Luteolibacter sp.]